MAMLEIPETTHPIILVQVPAQDRFTALPLMALAGEDPVTVAVGLLLREVMVDHRYDLADLRGVHQADLLQEVGPLQVDQVLIERINQV